MVELNKRLPVRVNPILRHQYEQSLTLNGKWSFRLDPEDKGKSLQWFKKPEGFKDRIAVPGCWQGQGFGNEGKDEVWDFKIQARIFRATYHGTGWYGKNFRVPGKWKREKIWLNLGGVSPSAEFWLNGKKLGSHSGPFVPFAFDVTNLVSSENDNFLSVRIYEENRWLGLSYNSQGYWSGLYRGVELSTTGKSWLERFWIYPDVDGKRLKVYIRLGGNPEPTCLAIKVSPAVGNPVAEITKNISKTGEIRFDLPIPSPKLWSPDEPNLYRVDALLYRGEEILDALVERVGFVKISTKGKHFLINDQPYYLRGTGDFIINPETGSPDTDRDRWRKKLTALKDYGYNYVRCQSYVPAPEYYDVADEVGLLVQGEMGMLGAWGGNSIWHIYAWPPPLPEYRKWLRYQWDHTVMRDVNHPSANIYCASNELGQQTLFPQTAWQCYRTTKKIKPSAFVIWTDGGYNPKLPADFINAEAEIDKKSSLPVIQHEFRWWSAYPDIGIKDKYRGAVRPYAIEIAEEAAAANKMTGLLPLAAQNSQRLQYLEAKTKLERCRRDNPRIAGICHFTAMDFGLSPQGIIDEFYETKYVEPETWRQTNGDTVILIDRNFADRILIGGEIFQTALSISDFSHPPLRNPELEWRLTEGKRCLASGKLAFRAKPFRTHPLGKIEVVLPETAKPLTIKLQAMIIEGKRTFSNQWNFWIFPKGSKFPESVGIYGRPKNTWLKKLENIPCFFPDNLFTGNMPPVIMTEIFDENMSKYVSKGGRVLLNASEGLVRPFYPKLGITEGRYFFLPPANYPPYEDGHTGTAVQSHPALGDFPHQGFCGLPFYRMIAESPPVSLKPFGSLSREPVIRVFGTYVCCQQLAYLMEFSLGKGGLIICGLDLNPNFPEARYLLYTILQYAVGDRFRPKERLSEKGLKHLLNE